MSNRLILKCVSWSGKFCFAGMLLVSFLSVHVCLAEMEFNSSMMESTFKIEGQGTGGKTLVGTGFVLFKPSAKNPGHFLQALVTADHVLREITGTNATLILRKKDASGKWRKNPFSIQIRTGQTNQTGLWFKHPKLDLAAMFAVTQKGVLPKERPENAPVDSKVVLPKAP